MQGRGLFDDKNVAVDPCRDYAAAGMPCPPITSVGELGRQASRDWLRVPGMPFTVFDFAFAHILWLQDALPMSALLRASQIESLDAQNAYTDSFSNPQVGIGVHLQWRESGQVQYGRLMCHA
jgi:hypothetical protein